MLTLGITLRDLKRSLILDEAALRASTRLIEQATGDQPSDQAASLRAGVSAAIPRMVRGRKGKPSPSFSIAQMILSNWAQNPKYKDPSGRPVELPVTGSVPSFRSLFRCAAGRADGYRASLQELINARCVEFDEDLGLVRLLSSNYVHTSEDKSSLRMACNAYSILGQAIAHNVSNKRHADGLSRKKLIQRTAWSKEIPVDRATEALEALQGLARDQHEEAVQLLSRFENDEVLGPTVELYHGVVNFSSAAADNVDDGG